MKAAGSVESPAVGEGDAQSPAPKRAAKRAPKATGTTGPAVDAPARKRAATKTAPTAKAAKRSRPRAAAAVDQPAPEAQANGRAHAGDEPAGRPPLTPEAA